MSNQRLREEIRYEIEQLRQVAEMAQQLSVLPAEERHPWDSAAAAKYVFDLVLGLENLWKSRCRALGETYPSGFDSHSQVLEGFLQESNLGGQLTKEESMRWKKYFRFRHRFAHGYGHEIHWEIVDEPLRYLPETVEKLAALWEEWLKRF
jgi:uncharacterized protein YhdP